MVKHYCIRVAGKVQGVFFRAATLEKARTLGVKGFVRNEADGSVYIEAEGDETHLTEFVAWCRSGPPRAFVRSCDLTEAQPKNFRDFQIQR